MREFTKAHLRELIENAKHDGLFKPAAPIISAKSILASGMLFDAILSALEELPPRETVHLTGLDFPIVKNRLLPDDFPGLWDGKRLIPISQPYIDRMLAEAEAEARRINKEKAEAHMEDITL